MSIASALKFAQGAVSKKDFVPALTHFQINAGRVTGYDGKLSLSAPIALDLECCPKAAPFVNAVEACTDTAQLNLTPTGKLSIRSGKFRAHVECLPVDAFPFLQPEGVTVAIDGGLLPALRTLYEFSAEDASRPWAAGVLLDGGSAFATNNVILVEAWLGYHFPYRVNLPRFTIREMLRIGEEPVGMQLTSESVTFHYSEDRWLRSQHNSIEWPNIRDMLDQMSANVPANVPPVPEELWAALETLKPFVSETGQLFVSPNLVCTAIEDGASVEVPGMPICSFNHKMLAMLQSVAQRADFAAWPNPVAFYGDKLRGLIAGMKA
jgi:DNA polymerase III sliding clamp (beta) subunit (PCNA family)